MKKLLFLFVSLAAGMFLFASTAIERPEGLTDLTSPAVGATPKVMDFKKKIDFVLSAEAQTALGEGAVDGVPVAIRVSTAIRGFDYADMNASGTDVIFGAVDESAITRYPYELEKWDPNGESVFWVRVPSLSAATTISMCYGNNVCVLDNDPTGVWSDYIGVWHMTGGDGNEIDVTGHGLNGVPTGSKLEEMASDANAPVGLGRVNQTTAGKYNRLSVPNYNDFISDHSHFTVSGWFKATKENGYPRPMSRKTSYDESTGWETQYNSNSKTQCEMRGSSGTPVTMDGPDVTADWVHLSYVFNGTSGTAYANGGASKKSGTITAVAKRDDPMAIGNNSNGSEQGWCGSYDEVRLYDGVQSDARVKSEYLAMTPGFLANDGVKTLDPEAPELGACTLTKVRDGEYRVDGVMAKNGAAVKLVFSAVGGEVVEKALGEQSEGVPFTTFVTNADGLSDAYPYDVKIVVVNDHGAQEKSLGVIGLWLPTSVNDFAKKFTVTVPETVTEALEGFPLLVRLSAANVEGFDYGDIRQDGADIVAADAAGNFFPCELQKYDPNGESLLWVRVPSMAAGTEITIYYGNPKPLFGIPPAKDTWRDYAGVWHLDEAEGAVARDSAGVSDGTISSKASKVASAVLGGGLTMGTTAAKNGPCVTVPKSVGLDNCIGAFAVSGWAKFNTDGNWGYFFSRKSADSYSSWGVQCCGASNNGRQDKVRLWSNGVSDQDQFATTTMNNAFKTGNDWAKYQFVYTGTEIKTYVNGAFVSTATATPGAAVNGSLDFAIGGLVGTDNHGTLPAQHDEVKIHAGAVGAEWAAAEYAQETGVFGTYGAAEQVDSSAPTFLTPIATVDAQGEATVVITVVKGSGSVYVDVDGEKTKVGDIDTEGAYPQEFVAHPTIAADKDAFISAYGISANGTEVYKKAGCGTMNAAVVVTNTRDAKEDGLVPGLITFSRPDTATNQDLIVNLAWSGTAEAGVDYEDNLPAAVTIPAGETAVTVEVAPIINMAKGFDATVVCTVTAGPYIAGGTATLAIKDVKLNDGFNTWVGGGADDKASTAENWSLGVPQNGQAILFDGRFANPANKNCDWDIDTSTVTSWTQNNGYDGTVTLRTVYPGKSGMEVLTVTGAMTIESGTLTHPQSRTMDDERDAQWDWIGDLKANETYRIRIDCASLAIGANGAIDVKTKGYYASHDSARCNASHGGTTHRDAPAYGDPKEPIHIGMAQRGTSNYWNGRGGGAIYMTVTGAAVVDGVIAADSGKAAAGSGAAGSVYLKAHSLAGSGSITAIGSAGGDGNYKGTGGRIAIVTETPVNRATFAKISAEAEWKNTKNGQATEFGGCGTVFFKDKDHANGILVVAGKSDWPELSNDKIYRVTPVGTEGDWTFDAVEFGRGGRLIIPVGTALHLPNGFTSITGTSDDPQYAGIRYEGGTLNLGNATIQTMGGGWMFTPWTNYVFNGSLTVQGGAAIGVPGWGNPVDEKSTLPMFVSCNLEVTGDLTIASDGSAVARNCGFRKKTNSDENGVFGCQAHGGRTLHYGKTLKLHYQGYDSVFAPFLPGCGAPEPNGQASEPSGGVIKLTVGGALTVEGKIDANGHPDANGQGGNDAGGVGGAIDITAGSLAGSGKISAEGGSMAWQRGAGGRVAVKLTDKDADFTAFTGYISASGRCAATTGASEGDTSSGTVYLQTGAEGEKAGTIVVKHRVSSQYYTSNATNTTEIVSLGYGGDAVEDYKCAKVEVRDYGFAAVNTDVRLAQMTIATVDAKLDLEGHTLTVDTFRYPDADGKLKKLKPGTYTLAQLKALGIERVCDSVGGGLLVVRGTGMVLLVR